MSFVGSRDRIVNWLWEDKELWFQLAVAWWAITLVLTVWWSAILMWYLFFGLLLVPYRLLRRGSRKRKIQDKQHRELLEAIKANKTNG
jgi:Flp pilus assembly protein TadB